MLVTRALPFKQDFKKFCDAVTQGEIVIISRPNLENVVLISEKKFNEMEKKVKINE